MKGEAVGADVRRECIYCQHREQRVRFGGSGGATPSRGAARAKPNESTLRRDYCNAKARGPKRGEAAVKKRAVTLPDCVGHVSVVPVRLHVPSQYGGLARRGRKNFIKT